LRIAALRRLHSKADETAAHERERKSKVTRSGLETKGSYFLVTAKKQESILALIPQVRSNPF